VRKVFTKRDIVRSYSMNFASCSYLGKFVLGVGPVRRTKQGNMLSIISTFIKQCQEGMDVLLLRIYHKSVMWGLCLTI
jgi:hypothetical protein